jgi:hypothetical protein
MVQAPTADKPAATSRPRAAAERPANARPPASARAAAKPTPGGDYFVQVGAFRDAATAKRVAARLRERKFSVVESDTSVPAAATTAPRSAAPAPAPAGEGTDRYDVHVTNGAPADLAAKLTAKGLATQPAGAGVVVTPSLPLRDAVALSKDLATEGMKVQVRRAGGRTAAAAPAPPAAASETGERTLHRVRVGPYADRAAALAAAKDLEAAGYKGFIARGGS